MNRKTIKEIWGAVRLSIMGLLGIAASLFNVSPSLGAKTGSITSPSGADANMRTLGDTTPTRDTLAGIVRSAFGLASALKMAVIDFFSRKAIVLPTATNVATVVAEGVLVGVLTKDDPTKGSSPWTLNTAGNGGSGVAASEAGVEAITAARKPSLSVESLNNGIEDVSVDLEADNLALFTVIDQASGEVRVYQFAPENDNPSDAAIALAEDAQFVQTLDTTGGAQFGE